MGSVLATRLIILAAGNSSRMRNSEPPSGLSDEQIRQANTLHKSMIKVGPHGERFVDYLLKNAHSAGLIEVAFVVSDSDTTIRDHYYNGSTNQTHKLKLHFVEQAIPLGRQKPAGTADAIVQVVKSIPSWQNETVLVCNGDNLYSANAFTIMVNTPHENALLSYTPEGLGFTQDKLTAMGIVVSENSLLKTIIEKPDKKTLKQLQKKHKIGVSMSLFRFFMPKALPYLEGVEFDAIHNEKFATNAIADMQKSGIPFGVESISESLPDLTTKSDILEVQKFLLHT